MSDLIQFVLLALAAVLLGVSLTLRMLIGLGKRYSSDENDLGCLVQMFYMLPLAFAVMLGLLALVWVP